LLKNKPFYIGYTGKPLLTSLGTATTIPPFVPGRESTSKPRPKREREFMEKMPTVSGTANLVDILDRVLDKGLVIAGDVRISLANVELLTIRIRLLICSVDKAEQIGLNWWKYDPHLTMQGPLPASLPEAQRAARRPRAARAAKPRRRAK
jgi:hypothetical protein